jgi:hypothetical protein
MMIVRKVKDLKVATFLYINYLMEQPLKIMYIIIQRK